MTDEQYQNQQRARTSRLGSAEDLEEAKEGQQLELAGGKLQDADEKGAQVQHRPLVRQLSAPTRLRAPERQPPVNSPGGHNRRQRPLQHSHHPLAAQMETKRSSADSELEHQKLRRHLHLAREQRHRHSHSGLERNYLQQERERRRLRNNNPDHKSADSPTCSASDSAFSQSQTTLESEGEQSLKGSARSAYSSCDCNARKTANLHDDEDEDDDHCGRCSKRKLSSHEDEDSPEQFKIVWRNLSYRVPDKRFARLSAHAGRLRERICPPDEQQASEEHLQLPGETTGAPDGAPMGPPKVGKPRKVIFSRLNGCVRSGQLTAILGPSGAGKTTFLKCLTGSIVSGVSGSIDLIDGPTDTSHLKLCIIPQKDYLFDNLTVMENLLFASRIKNTQANFDHTQNVQRVADLLGLQACLKLKTSKLSGGQYKRVSIAQELLSKPDILILDEPTSGLDSLTCFRTVSVLRDLVNLSRLGLMRPLAIVMTIHQPQIKIFNLFHQVYILSSMGECVYEGRPGYLIDTVADCCKLLPPPDDLNPASFIIDLASEVYGSRPIEQLVRLQRQNSDLAYLELVSRLDSLSGAVNTAQTAPQAQESARSASQKSATLDMIAAFEGADIAASKLATNVPEQQNQLRVSEKLRRRNTYERSFWLHTGLLIRRLWTSTWRDPLLTTTRITFHLIIPFVFYFIYSQKSGAANACPYVEREINLTSLTSDENIQRLESQHNELILTFENTSLFFLLLYSFSMCVLAVTALSFPLNMQILLKETSNGWYSMPRFVMAKTLADLPIELTMPMISVAIAYILTGQPSSYLCWRMLTVTAVMTLCSLIAQTQGLLFGAYFMNNIQAAVFVSQASSLPWIMLSGFTTRIRELPTLLQWLSFGSVYRLGIESIVAVRYGFGICPCDQEMLDDGPTRIVGIPDQLRSVMRYYMDMYSDSSNTSNRPANSTSGDIFEKVASTLSRANTYGVDVVSCHDVRPFIMSAREVDETTLPIFLLILAAMFFGLKILLFFVVRLRAG